MRTTIASLLSRWNLATTLVVSTLIAIVAAAATANVISLLPPGVHARQQQTAGAALHVTVDQPVSKIADPLSTSADLSALSGRAYLLGNILASPTVVDIIARRVGIDPGLISAVPELTANVPATMRDPDLERHATEVVRAHKPYRLDIQADPNLPVLNIFSQAPTPGAAQALANESIEGLKEYLRALAAKHGVAPDRQVVLTPMGAARGGVINGHVPKEIAALAFMLAFSVSLALLHLLPRAWRGWVAAKASEQEEGSPQSAAPLADGRARAPLDDGGDWPRTSRVLPWMIAGFIAMLWLVPFNLIQLNASGPIDLKLDRLVLPVIFVVWVLAMAAGGPAAPRVRLTWIHGGIAIFVGFACLSAVLDSSFLNHTLLFELSVKKLTLLLSFAMFFVLVASVVRPSEVPAFLKYSLVLSVICAIGTIWQYRFQYDVFYDLAGKLLPGIFTVGSPGMGVDDLGRAMTEGPAEHPLEAAAMMSMALPIALVALMRSTVRRDRILYGLGACLLLGAAIATYRKSALLGPLGIVLTIAYFRRRELLRLAPFGLLSVVLIHVISPGALGSVLFQFRPNRLGVGTISDRASDYDAIRPDVWSHLPFGLGYGSYDHSLYRVLDSEILNRLVDTGVVGVLSFILMLVTIVLAARGPIRARDPVWGAPALIVGSAAVSYLVLAFLFDVSSFPHTPYILMSLAGLLATRAKAGHQPAPRRRRAHAPTLQPAKPARRLEHGRPLRATAGSDVHGPH